MENFVKTSDQSTANKLLSVGFILVDKSNGFWTFINNKNLQFNKDTCKLQYTNQIHI